MNRDPGISVSWKPGLARFRSRSASQEINCIKQGPRDFFLFAGRPAWAARNDEECQETTGFIRDFIISALLFRALARRSGPAANRKK